MKGRHHVRRIELHCMTDFEKAFNELALFHAAGADPADSGTYVHPCIALDEVQVYAYVQDGTLVVSIHLDGATDPPFRKYGSQYDQVPVVVNIGDEQVFAAHPRAEPEGRHHRPVVEGPWKPGMDPSALYVQPGTPA
jgi:hypothetical protein